MRRIAAATVAGVCLIGIVGSAAADETQTLTISNATSVTEGGTATFTVSLSDGPDPEATVDYTTVDGTATDGEDYATESATITVPAGGSTNITVSTVEDTIYEASENFSVTLSNPDLAVIGDATGTGTITDDDAAPTLAISGPTSVGETGTATYSVAISGSTAVQASVDFATANGTATAGSDYTATSGPPLTWAPGDTAAKQIVVNISSDLLDENDETFAVNLSGASGATIADNSAGTTITDDDDPPTTGAFADVSTAEGNSGSHNLDFTVALSSASGKPITINYSTIDGTATNANNDYEPEVGLNLTIPAGQTSGTISIAINGDGTPEPNETFTVNLNSGTDVTLGADTQAVGTINNDDSGVTASINDVSVTEGNTGTVSATFTVTLSSAAPAPATITYRTADGSAASPGDYTGVGNTVLNFPQGALNATITIPVIGDTLPEGNENFFVDLVASTGPVTISDNRGTATINDNDTAPSVSIGDATVTEGNAGNVNATFTVSLTGATQGPATFTYRTADGSAASPGDYTGVGNTVVNIPNGGMGATITVPVKGDTLPEPNETFFVDIVSVTGPITLSSDSRGTGTITDDDSAVTASINDITVTEGNGPNVNATFTVSLSSAAPAQVQLQYQTQNGSAVTPGDYTGVGNTTLTIPGGSSSGTITIVVKGDTLPEGTSENFFVDLVSVISGPASIGPDSRGIGTITDDDAPVTASINDIAVIEGNTGTVNATFTVTLSGQAVAPVDIRYSTSNGSAVTPDDYTGVSNALLTIPQGASSGTFNIVVKGDTLPEGTGSPLAETFVVDLISATGPATLSADSRGTASITDDDNPVSASINDVSVNEGNTGNATATFTVTLSGPAAAQVQIRYSTLNGTAVTPNDYTGVTNATLTIAQGATSGTFNITVKGDTVPEGAGNPLVETFFVDLQSVLSGPATISADSRGNGSIIDDDSPVTASINDVTVTEGNSGTVNATFTVQLSGPAQGTVQIRYSTVSGSASTPGDYTGVSNQLLSIPATANNGTFNIVVNGDTTFEGNENFFVDLISATGPATISADSRGAGTIAEDDPAPPAPGGGGGSGGGNAGLPSLTISDPLVKEGENATFTITLAGDTTKAVTVRANTTNGSATGGEDFVARDETLTFAPGEKTKTIVLSILDDTFPEESETFWLRLTNATNASIAKSLGTATIAASDQVTPQGGGTDGALLPRMVLGPATVNVFAKGFAIMTVSCHKASPIACSGSIVLEKPGKPVVKLGTKPFTVKKGTKKSVRVYLSARALKLLTKTKTGTMRVRAVVLVKNSLKKSVRVVPGSVTLRATQGLLSQTKTTTEVKVPTKPKPSPTKVEILP